MQLRVETRKRKFHLEEQAGFDGGTHVVSMLAHVQSRLCYFERARAMATQRYNSDFVQEEREYVSVYSPTVNKHRTIHARPNSLSLGQYLLICVHHCRGSHHSRSPCPADICASVRNQPQVDLRVHVSRKFANNHEKRCVDPNINPIEKQHSRNKSSLLKTGVGLRWGTHVVIIFAHAHVQSRLCYFERAQAIGGIGLRERVFAQRRHLLGRITPMISVRSC